MSSISRGGTGTRGKGTFYSLAFTPSVTEEGSVDHSLCWTWPPLILLHSCLDTSLPPPCLLDTSVLPCLLASVQNLTWDAPGETTGWQLKSSSTLLFTLLAPNIIPNNSVPDVVETSEFLNNSHFLVTLTSSLVRCQSQGELFCN